MNVTLIGMAGAGKSYFGTQLGERLGFRWIDIDQELERAYGKPIQAILDEVGEEHYLDAEAAAFLKAVQGDQLILSPGGSLVYRPAAMDHAKACSKVVYLRVPFTTVESRLQGLPPRAIIGLGKKTLRELYDERQPLYEKYADLIIDVDETKSKEIVDMIAEYLDRR